MLACSQAEADITKRRQSRPWVTELNTLKTQSTLQLGRLCLALILLSGLINQCKHRLASGQRRLNRAAKI